MVKPWASTTHRSYRYREKKKKHVLLHRMQPAREDTDALFKEWIVVKFLCDEHIQREVSMVMDERGELSAGRLWPLPPK